MGTCMTSSLSSTQQEQNKRFGAMLQGDSESEFQVQQQLPKWHRGDFRCRLYTSLFALENGDRINLQQYIHYVTLAVHLIVLRTVLISAPNFRT